VARRSAASAAASTEDLGLEWQGHGRYRFQGIGGEVEVFEVGVPGVAPLVAPTSSGKVRRVEAPRSAVEQPKTQSPGDEEQEATRAQATKAQPVVLRSWPPPKLPEQPYPVLLPYTHPEFLAGRDREIAGLRRLLLMPVPVLGLSAPSGTGARGRWRRAACSEP